MRLAITIICLFISLSSSACDKVIRAVYGPFFSVSFYNDYLSVSDAMIEELTGCKILMTIKPTHEKFIMALINGEADMTFVPSYYFEALKPYGLQAVFESKSDYREIIIINKKAIINSNNKANIQSLVGKAILSPGLYSRAHTMLIDWLNESNLIGKVQVDSGHRHDLIAMSLVKNTAAAGIITTAVFNRLPEALKRKFVVLKTSNIVKTFLLISKNAPSGLKSAMSKSMHHARMGNWGKVSNRYSEKKLSDRFKTHLEEIIVNNKP